MALAVFHWSKWAGCSHLVDFTELRPELLLLLHVLLKLSVAIVSKIKDSLIFDTSQLDKMCLGRTLSASIDNPD